MASCGFRVWGVGDWDLRFKGCWGSSMLKVGALWYGLGLSRVSGCPLVKNEAERTLNSTPYTLEPLNPKPLNPKH